MRVQMGILGQKRPSSSKSNTEHEGIPLYGPNFGRTGASYPHPPINHQIPEVVFDGFPYSQTWDLSKHLHDRIFGPQILHTKSV